MVLPTRATVLRADKDACTVYLTFFTSPSDRRRSKARVKSNGRPVKYYYSDISLGNRTVKISQLYSFGIFVNIVNLKTLILTFVNWLTTTDKETVS